MAIRERADRGSPCDPVVTHSTEPAGYDGTSLSRICKPAGIERQPSRIAISAFWTMLRPTKATFRPKRSASRTSSCTRYRLEANVATTSIPVDDVKISSNAPTTSSSDPVKPGRSMLVLSAKSASTPSEPSVAKRWRSKCCPSSGV
jgi:hypothetical protein